MHPPPQDRQWPVRSFSLAHVTSLIHLHLSSEKSSAARGDFFTEQRKSSLKYDEMWELMVKKRNHDGNDFMDAAVGVGCESIVSQ